MINTADIVIIGGGVHGASLAYNLARKKAGKIVLLEKKHMASGPTAKSSAMIRPLFNELVYVQLVSAATKMFEQWGDSVGGSAGFVQNGFLRITDSLDNAALGGDLELAKSQGVNFQVIPNDELKNYAPNGKFDEKEIAVLFPEGGYADPYLTTLSLAAAAKRLGAEIIEGVSVTGIKVSQGRIDAVQTDAGEISTRTVINCAGAWSDRIAAFAGVQLPIEIHRIPICLFRRPLEINIENPVFSDGTHGVYLRKADENIFRSGLFGSEKEPADPDTYDETLSKDQLPVFRRPLDQRFSAMRKTYFTGGFSAVYDMTPDGHPIIGRMPEVDGFWCDCGWSGNGFASSPVIGHSLATEILGGKSEIDISYFGWPRSQDVTDRRK
jgi:sarcosine oxidase subunit beta